MGLAISENQAAEQTTIVENKYHDRTMGCDLSASKAG
jgi:hypothetical protein